MYIIESLDSISRDGMDTPYIQTPKYLKTGKFVK